MKTKNKLILLALCAVLLVGGSVMGTVAFLRDQTKAANNAMSVGQVQVKLVDSATMYVDEKDQPYWTNQMVPGQSIKRDAKAVVLANSAECYLFVKVTESENLDSFVKYTFGEGWYQLSEGLYCRVAESSKLDQEFAILEKNEMVVLEKVTEGMLKELTDKTQPTLAFDVYACQTQGFQNAKDAWAKISEPTT